MVTADAAAKGTGRAENRSAGTGVRALHRDKTQGGRKIHSRRLTEIIARIRIIPLSGVTKDRAAVRIHRTHNGASRRI